MEIFKELNTPQSKEFEKLLNNQLSKIQIEEGKIIDGKINKITEKYVFLFIENLKSEPVLDINELKSIGLSEKIKIGETIPVLLEKIEDKNGEVLVSASKAQKSFWSPMIWGRPNALQVMCCSFTMENLVNIAQRLHFSRIQNQKLPKITWLANLSYDYSQINKQEMKIKREI